MSRLERLEWGGGAPESRFQHVKPTRRGPRFFGGEGTQRGGEQKLPKCVWVCVCVFFFFGCRCSLWFKLTLPSKLRVCCYFWSPEGGGQFLKSPFCHRQPV